MTKLNQNSLAQFWRSRIRVLTEHPGANRKDRRVFRYRIKKGLI
jgi:hypothetical protein